MFLKQIVSAGTTWLLPVAFVASLACGSVAAAGEHEWVEYETYMKHGTRAYHTRLYAHAEDWFLEAVREAERLDPKGPRLVRALRSLAEVYRKQGQQTQAEALLRRATTLSGQYPAEESAGPNVATSLENYAAFLREIGRDHDAAMVEMRVQTLRQMRRGVLSIPVLGFNPVEDLRDYAVLLREQGREAEAHAMEVLAAAEASKQVEHYRGLRERRFFGTGGHGLTWEQRMVAGIEAMEGGLNPEAQGLFEAAVKEAEAFRPGDVRLAVSLSFLAATHAFQYNDAAADRAVERALPILERAAGLGHSLLPHSLKVLALAYLGPNLRPVKALQYFQRALPILEKHLVRDHPIVGLHLAGLAASHLALSQPEQAKTYLERALTIADKQYLPEHAAVALGVERVAALYMEQGRYAQADSLMRRVLTVLAKMFDPGHPLVVRVRQSHANIRREMNQREKARVNLETRTTVPIQVVGNVTLVSATFNRSQRALLLVDTGADSTLITPVLLARLGLSVPKNAPQTPGYVVGGKRIGMPHVTVSALQVGDATIENFEVGVYEAFPKSPGIDGLLGGDFLQQFRITLDKTTRRMVLEPLPR